MISKNIFIILIILVVITLVVYFYYQSDKPTSLSNPTIIQPFQSVKIVPTKKKVRFNDKVEYKYYKSYPKNKTRSQITTPKAKYPTPPPSPISIASDLDDSPSQTQIVGDNIDIDRIMGETKPKNKSKPNNVVIPSNFEQDNPEEKWDASFGLLLMDPKEQADYFVKMMDNYKNYTNTVNQFHDYLTDTNTLIKNETTIDPFKPSKQSNKLKGKSVAEIYDEQVAGPQAIPKKIKMRTDNKTIYVDESSMNGGKIFGTNLVGVDEYGHKGVEQYELASFGNGF